MYEPCLVMLLVYSVETFQLIYKHVTRCKTDSLQLIYFTGDMSQGLREVSSHLAAKILSNLSREIREY